jgi:acyl-CoA synthetase (AMP-forming)/AMP-acid ligase II
MSSDFLLDRLSRYTKEQPDKKVFSFIGPGIDGGRIQKGYTYNEIAIETSQLAQRLLLSGLKAGDR